MGHHKIVIRTLKIISVKTQFLLKLTIMLFGKVVHLTNMVQVTLKTVGGLQVIILCVQTVVKKSHIVIKTLVDKVPRQVFRQSRQNCGSGRVKNIHSLIAHSLQGEQLVIRKKRVLSLHQYMVTITSKHLHPHPCHHILTHILISKQTTLIQMAFTFKTAARMCQCIIPL